jgi:hypothetical protein
MTSVFGARPNPHVDIYMANLATSPLPPLPCHHMRAPWYQFQSPIAKLSFSPLQPHQRAVGSSSKTNPYLHMNC